MKKILLVIIVAMFAGIVISGCKSASKCPAYGEVYKYQRNPRH
ncbi:MAG: hypothetical protein ACEPOV_03620 [Hyphomicrobiales bacterium]